MDNKQKLEYLVNELSKSAEGKMISLLQDLFFNPNQSIELCAQKAYGDLKRQLDGIGKMPNDLKDKYKSAVYYNLFVNISDLTETVSINCQKDFDEWHYNTCKGIIDISEDKLCEVLQNQFTVGLAQKWLNMTLKNMLVAKSEGVFKKVDDLRPFLHVPIDRYVLSAAYNHLGIRRIEVDRGVINLNKNGSPTLNGENLPWSSLNDYKCYIEIQRKIKERVEIREDYEYPIDWEFDAWMNGVLENQ